VVAVEVVVTEIGLVVAPFPEDVTAMTRT